MDRPPRRWKRGRPRPSSKEPRMKAAVVHDYTHPLVIEDVPMPEPGDEQVLVRMEASGLCHTDIHAARGEWPVKPPLPFIPGHEGVGIVERVGPGNAHGIVEGMRVALPWLGYACGDCTYCNTGWETLCESQQKMGYSLNGGGREEKQGSLENGGVRQMRGRLPPPRRRRPRPDRPARRRAADVRRGDD